MTKEFKAPLVPRTQLPRAKIEGRVLGSCVRKRHDFRQMALHGRLACTVCGEEAPLEATPPRRTAKR